MASGQASLPSGSVAPPAADGHRAVTASCATPAPDAPARRGRIGIFARRTAEAIPTLRDVLERAAQGRSRAVPGARPPHIPTSTKHYLFALLVVGAGYNYADACDEVGVSQRTAEDWRRDLRQSARDYFGREVEYDYAARYALDQEWQKKVDLGLASQRA